MKSRILKLIVLYVLLFNLSSCTKNKNEVLYDRDFLKEIKAARKEIVFYMARNSVPGATFAVAREGKIIYSEGLGLASKDLEVPVFRTTKFRIGQLSEIFTSLLYHQLTEKGILHPDSTVQVYYPTFPEKKHELTLRHLVQHTSGLREPNAEEKDWRGLNISIQKGIENLLTDTLIASPGTNQVPNMFNYNLLGAVMEEATGTLFPNLLKQYITDTLNLENTVIDNPFITIKGRSNYFDHNIVAQVVNATLRDMRYRAPSEGILSNAEDLVNYGNALLFSESVANSIRVKLFEPITLKTKEQAKMTNGWILLNDRNERKIYGRSGNVTGGSAAIIIYPDEKLVIACATNLSSFSDDLPVFAIAEHFLPEAKQVQQ